MLYYEEAVEFFSGLEAKDEWLDFCVQREIYHFYTVEYVDLLSNLLKGIKSILSKFTASSEYVLEIASGRGILGAELRKRNIPVILTDINPVSAEVEKLSASESLKKYNPYIVIGSWFPADAGIETQIINYPSVKCFIDICQEVNGVVGSELSSFGNWNKSLINEAKRYSLCRYDYTNPFGEIMKHSHLFKLTK